jgi:hypothetical protein
MQLRDCSDPTLRNRTTTTAARNKRRSSNRTSVALLHHYLVVVVVSLEVFDRPDESSTRPSGPSADRASPSCVGGCGGEVGGRPTRITADITSARRGADGAARSSGRRTCRPSQPYLLGGGPAAAGVGDRPMAVAADGPVAKRSSTGPQRASFWQPTLSPLSIRKNKILLLLRFSPFPHHTNATKQTTTRPTTSSIECPLRHRLGSFARRETCVAGRGAPWPHSSNASIHRRSNSHPHHHGETKRRRGRG